MRGGGFVGSVDHPSFCLKRALHNPEITRRGQESYGKAHVFVYAQNDFQRTLFCHPREAVGDEGARFFLLD